MNEKKNYGKSIRARLLNVAKKENNFFQTILTRYFQKRYNVLLRIAILHTRPIQHFSGQNISRI